MTKTAFLTGVKIPCFTKPILTIPSSREVFLIKRGEETANKINDHYKNLSVDELRLRLEKLNSHGYPLIKSRWMLFSISKALSNHGIAPRWQRLDDACKTGDQEDALAEDAPIIDAYWLSITFPKHKTKNLRWQSLFTNGFDMELAVNISERQMTTAKKIRHDLKLSRLQQIGCIHYLRKSPYTVEGSKSALSLLKAAKERSAKRLEREIVRGNTTYQVTSKTAEKRAIIYECYLLADKSPTDSVKVYKWMTGDDINKSNIARTIQRMNNKVCRNHISVDIGG